MKTVHSIFGFLSLIGLMAFSFSLPSCYITEKQVAPVTGKLYRYQNIRSQVDWYHIGPRSQNALISFSSPYFVELQIRSSKGALAEPKIAAFFFGEGGSVLNIRVIPKAQTAPSGAAFVCYLDTDGYTEFLRLSKDDRGSPDRLIVFATGKAYETILPSKEKLNDSNFIELKFLETQKIVDVAKGKLANLERFSPHGPAVFRRQESQTAIYFYYLKPVPFVELAAFAGPRLSETEIATDLALSGISQDMELYERKVTPVK
jgi:hypothetical protein